MVKVFGLELGFMGSCLSVDQFSYELIMLLLLRLLALIRG